MAGRDWWRHNPNPNTDSCFANSDTNADTHCDADSHSDSHSDSDANADSHSDADSVGAVGWCSLGV